MKNGLVLGSLALVLFACAPDRDGHDLKKPLERFVAPISASSERFNPNEIHRWVAKTPLISVSSGAHYRLQTEFLSEDSELILHSHFMGFTRRDGVQLTFKKKSQDLIVLISSSRYQESMIHVFQNYFLSRSVMNLSTEVHNLTSVSGGSGSRVIIWIDPVHPVTGQVLVRQSFRLSQASFDSQTSDSSNAEKFFAPGRGVLWGVEYRGLRFFKAERRPSWVR